MKTYETCSKSVHERVDALIKKYHPVLHKARVRVEVLAVSTDGDGPALTLHGYACDGVVRKIGTKERAAGRGDAEIVLDRAAFLQMTSRQQDALLDHELYHLDVATEKRTGAPKFDSNGRPVLKLRKHDREFGWFDEIAQRWGEDSGEIRQARRLLSAAGQLYFNFTPPAPAAAVA
jgi:hypothetical protein